MAPLWRAVRVGELSTSQMENLVLDLAYVLGVIALFVLVGLVGKAVEKL